MGASGGIGCSEPLKQADWILIWNTVVLGAGTLVNAAFGFWIVRTIQGKMTDKRVLKDHFIVEIKELRSEYKSFLIHLYSNNIHPKKVIPWFKLMNIKIDDLMELISPRYKIDKNVLLPYQTSLRDLVTENEDFMQQFKVDKNVVFTEGSRASFIKFQQEHNKLFNSVITKINDAD